MLKTTRYTLCQVFLLVCGSQRQIFDRRVLAEKKITWVVSGCPKMVPFVGDMWQHPIYTNSSCAVPMLKMRFFG